MALLAKWLPGGEHMKELIPFLQQSEYCKGITPLKTRVGNLFKLVRDNVPSVEQFIRGRPGSSIRPIV
jgi:hypothetical protein